MIFFISTILMFFVYWGPETYWPAHMVFCTAATLFLSFKLKKVWGWSLSLLFGWTLLNALLTFMFKPSMDGVEIGQILTVRNCSMAATFDLLLYAWLFTNHWRFIRLPMAWGFYFVGVVHSLSLFLDEIWFHVEQGKAIGLLGNQSIGATFSVLWLFLSLHLSTQIEGRRWRLFVRWTSLVALPAILVSHSGISFIALLVGLMAYLYFIGFGTFGLGLLVSGLSFGAVIKPTFWKHMSRYDAWPMFLQFYHDHFPWWFGSGLGTFRFWGPVSQMESKFQIGHYWLFAHNDWLQIFLELGLPGFIFALLVYIGLVRKAKEPFLFCLVLVFGTTMVANYPLHSPECLLLGAWMVSEILWGDMSQECLGLQSSYYF